MYHTSRLFALFLALFCSALTARAALTANLSWNPNPESDIAGYYLYYGTASGQYTQRIDLGNTTTTSLPSLTAGTTYYFTVSAYDIDRVEGQAAPEVAFTPTAPAPTATGTINTLQLSPDGNVQLTVTFSSSSTNLSGGGGSGSTSTTSSVDVEYSNDLLSWSLLTSISNTTGTVTISDPNATQVARRFYRLVFH